MITFSNPEAFGKRHPDSTRRIKKQGRPPNHPRHILSQSSLGSRREGRWRQLAPAASQPGSSVPRVSDSKLSSGPRPGTTGPSFQEGHQGQEPRDAGAAVHPIPRQKLGNTGRAGAQNTEDIFFRRVRQDRRGPLQPGRQKVERRRRRKATRSRKTARPRRGLSFLPECQNRYLQATNRPDARCSRVPEARGFGRRRYVDLAGGQETVGRGFSDGPGSSRKCRDWVRWGAVGAAAGLISALAADPIRPIGKARRREATPRHRSSNREMYGAAPGGAALPRCRGGPAKWNLALWLFL